MGYLDERRLKFDDNIFLLPFRGLQISIEMILYRVIDEVEL
jgi:hypothetical protein